jgi:nicotinate-nucleotide pyrophosphorylase (carboxylating)
MSQVNTQLERAIIENVQSAIAEDVGSGDLTASLISAETQATAHIVTRDNGVFCGRPWADETCHQVDPAIACAWEVADGDEISSGQRLVVLQGPARSLLTAERTVLNFLQLLSGVATSARVYAALVADTNTRILDTRKTVPGLRQAQKYAVRCGGASNHRMGLFDAFLIKENHIAAAGSIEAAVRSAKTIAPGKPVEVEVENNSQLVAAVDAGADIVMLDNYSVEETREAVAISAGRAKLEASGGITADQIPAIAATGVDFISVGEITKQVKPLDLSMRFV